MRLATPEEELATVLRLSVSRVAVTTSNSRACHICDRDNWLREILTARSVNSALVMFVMDMTG